MSLLFVYETLRSSKVLQQVLGKVPPHRVAYGLHVQKRDAGDGYWTVEEQTGHTVKGFCLEVTPKELEKLDDWETRYKRGRLTVELDGKRQKAFVYLLKEGEK